MTDSIAIRVAMNSEPKVEDSVVFCALEYQITGARFTKIIMPV